ncbi:phosphate propanoyltransferase [Caproiciproducens sp.]
MSDEVDRDTLVRGIVESILKNKGRTDSFTVPVGISNHHVHLSQEDQDILFGKGYELHALKDLSQKKQFAAEETVLVAGTRGAQRMRVLGPVRKHTQVELLASDAHLLGVAPPLCESGKWEPSPTVVLIGPEGVVTVDHGVMVAWRHIHLDPVFASGVGAEDGNMAKVHIGGRRGLVFEQVAVRVGPLMTTEFHIDTDEANACGLKNGDEVEVTLYEP